MTTGLMIYNSFLDKVNDGTIDLDTVTFKAMLLSSAYTRSQTHDYRNDLTGEVSGTGYTAGGQVVTATRVRVGNTRSLTFSPAVWDATGGSLTARQAVIYVARGGAASADEVACCVYADADLTATNDTWTMPAQVINETNQSAA
jgi:hypothetical protein